MSVKILLVEAQEIFRVGLRSILAVDTRVSEVYESTNEKEMERQLSKYKPDLIVVNRELLKDIAVLRSRRFVIITNELNLAQLKEAYESGASGYLSVNVSSKILCSLLCCSHQAFLIEPALVPKVMEYVFGNNLSPFLDETLLTPREKEIICLVRRGIDRASIASQLCITEATLKTHLKNIAKKHNCSSSMTSTSRQNMDVFTSRAEQLKYISAS